MLEPDPVAGTGVDAAGLRVGITNGETGPGAIGIPANPWAWASFAAELARVRTSMVAAWAAFNVGVTAFTR
jgi:hypothetical protein